MAYVQIYLDGLSDLLSAESHVELREDPKEGVYVSGCQWETITDVAGTCPSPRPTACVGIACTAWALRGHCTGTA